MPGATAQSARVELPHISFNCSFTSSLHCVSFQVVALQPGLVLSFGLAPISCQTRAAPHDTVRRLFSIDTAIKPIHQLRSPHGEGVTYAKESLKGDGSAGLYLLPVASGEAKSNHVFLCESSGFAKLSYSLSEGAKELFLIDQACLLSD